VYALPAVAIATAVGACACGSSAPPPRATPSPVTVRLAHVPEGVATLGWDTQTQNVTVHLDVYGLAPAGSVELRLRQGSCLAPAAAALVTFPGVTADATGVVRTDVVSDQPQPAGIPHQAAIAVEAGGGGAAPSLLACTDIPASNATAPLRLFAPPALKPAGTATLTYDRGAATLDVRITAIGLPAGASVAAEIRRGSCEVQGALVRQLGGAVADGGGALSSAELLTHVAIPGAHWYVDVRPTSAAGAPRPGPLVCGDVTGQHA
jgi:hypothetical protein